jgi:mRNA interferase MazF
VRGEIYELRANPHAKGHEQRGRRYAVVLQSDTLALSTVLAAPTTTHSWDTSFHVEINCAGRRNRVLIEQLTAVDPGQRFGRKVGQVSAEEQVELDDAMKLVLGLL